MKRKWPLKAVAVALTVTLFTTNVLLAHTPEVSVWSERRKQPIQVASLPSSFSLPPLARPAASLSKQIQNAIPKGHENQYTSLLRALPQNVGSIRNVSIPSQSARTIIQIQDVHLNAEAQQNIEQAIQELIRQKKVDLVALEGAFGLVDFSMYRHFPHPDSVRAVADYLLRENKISGAVHTAFVSPEPIPTVVGVDDKPHYDANVAAYTTSAPQVKKLKQSLSAQEEDLSQKKDVAFSSELKAFDTLVQAHRKNQMAWGDYVQALVKRSDNTTHDVDVLVAALQQEKALDFNRVEKERAELLTNLVAKLSAAESSDLLNLSAAYRVGTLSHTDFYQSLKQLCASHRLSLSRFPAMDNYIRYVLLSDAINVEKVSNDVTNLEKTIYASLAKTETEKNLIQEDRALTLIGKLWDFSLTREEWAEYKQLASTKDLVPLPVPFNDFNNAGTVPALMKSLNGTVRGEARSGVDSGAIALVLSPPLPPPLAGRGTNALGSLSSFEKFYEEALARDTAMTENLLRAMDESHAKVAVLVTGGFHTHGMAQQMNRKGIATIAYAPKISKVEDENGTSYLSVFTQEKTPLDKLFAGEILFVTPPVVTAPQPTVALMEAHYQAVSTGRTTGAVTSGDVTYKVEITPATGAILKATAEAPLTRTAIFSLLTAGFGKSPSRYIARTKVLFQTSTLLLMSTFFIRSRLNPSLLLDILGWFPSFAIAFGTAQLLTLNILKLDQKLSLSRKELMHSHLVPATAFSLAEIWSYFESLYPDFLGSSTFAFSDLAAVWAGAILSYVFHAFAGRQKTITSPLLLLFLAPILFLSSCVSVLPRLAPVVLSLAMALGMPAQSPKDYYTPANVDRMVTAIQADPKAAESQLINLMGVLGAAYTQPKPLDPRGERIGDIANQLLNQTHLEIVNSWGDQRFLAVLNAIRDANKDPRTTPTARSLISQLLKIDGVTNREQKLSASENSYQPYAWLAALALIGAFLWRWAVKGYKKSLRFIIENGPKAREGIVNVFKTISTDRHRQLHPESEIQQIVVYTEYELSIVIASGNGARSVHFYDFSKNFDSPDELPIKYWDQPIPGRSAKIWGQFQQDGITLIGNPPRGPKANSLLPFLLIPLTWLSSCVSALTHFNRGENVSFSTSQSDTQNIESSLTVNPALSYAISDQKNIELTFSSDSIFKDGGAQGIQITFERKDQLPVRLTFTYQNGKWVNEQETTAVVTGTASGVVVTIPPSAIPGEITRISTTLKIFLGYTVQRPSRAIHHPKNGVTWVRGPIPLEVTLYSPERLAAQPAKPARNAPQPFRFHHRGGIFALFLAAMLGLGGTASAATPAAFPIRNSGIENWILDHPGLTGIAMGAVILSAIIFFIVLSIRKTNQPDRTHQRNLDSAQRILDYHNSRSEWPIQSVSLRDTPPPYESITPTKPVRADVGTRSGQIHFTADHRFALVDTEFSDHDSTPIRFVYMYELDRQGNPIRYRQVFSSEQTIPGLGVTTKWDFNFLIFDVETNGKNLRLTINKGFSKYYQHRMIFDVTDQGMKLVAAEITADLEAGIDPNLVRSEFQMYYGDAPRISDLPKKTTEKWFPFLSFVTSLGLFLAGCTSVNDRFYAAEPVALSNSIDAGGVSSVVDVDGDFSRAFLEQDAIEFVFESDVLFKDAGVRGATVEVYGKRGQQGFSLDLTQKDGQWAVLGNSKATITADDTRVVVTVPVTEIKQFVSYNVTGLGTTLTMNAGYSATRERTVQTPAFKGTGTRSSTVRTVPLDVSVRATRPTVEALKPKRLESKPAFRFSPHGRMLGFLLASALTLSGYASAEMPLTPQVINSSSLTNQGSQPQIRWERFQAGKFVGTYEPTIEERSRGERMVARLIDALKGMESELRQENDPSLADVTAFREKMSKGISLMIDPALGARENSQGALATSFQIETDASGAPKLVTDVGLFLNLFENLLNQLSDPFDRKMITAMFVKEGATIRDAQIRPQFYSDMLVTRTNYQGRGSFDTNHPLIRELLKVCVSHWIESEAVGFRAVIGYFRRHGIDVMAINQRGRNHTNKLMNELMAGHNNIMISTQMGPDENLYLNWWLLLMYVGQLDPVLYKNVYEMALKEGKIAAADLNPDFFRQKEAVRFSLDPKYALNETLKRITAEMAQQNVGVAGGTQTPAPQTGSSSFVRFAPLLGLGAVAIWWMIRAAKKNKNAAGLFLLSALIMNSGLSAQHVALTASLASPSLQTASPPFLLVGLVLFMAVILYLGGRNWYIRRQHVNKLAYAIHSHTRHQNLANATVAKVLANINYRMPTASFKLAHGLQLSGTSEPLQKNFALGLGLINANRSIISTTIHTQSAVRDSLNNHRALATVVHISNDRDVMALESAADATINYNRDKKQRRGIALTLSKTLPATTRLRAMNLINQLKNRLPLSVFDENEIGSVDEIPYTVLFEKLGRLFRESGQVEIAEMYQRLAKEDTAGTKILIIGTPATPYTASEKLLQIMLNLVTTAHGSILIDISIVLLAAKQA